MKVAAKHQKRDKLVQFIAEHPDLADAIAQADARSESIGASLFEYVTIYRAIHKWQARTVLECGTGKTTYILAAAMRALGRPVRLVSMEHDEAWYRQAKEHFPFEEFPFVDLRHSPEAVWGISLLRGTVYSEVPTAPYDFVFVDGPSLRVDGEVTCNLDFVRLVSQSDRSIPAIVDNRKTTVLAYTILFPRKVRFACGLGIVDPVSRADCAFGDQGVLLQSFKRLVDVFADDPIELWCKGTTSQT